MKKSVLISLIVVALIGICVVWAVGRYNTMVTLQENVENAWGQVQNQYQRRADLIPNLVATVKGYAKQEMETYTAVQEARSKATQITIDPSHITPEQLTAFQQAQGELSTALGRLIAIQENYPDLKANENFKELQVQLEGTENRINEARNTFNAAVQEYNVTIRRFPKSLLAGMFGFDKMSKFEAEAGAEKAPQVKF